MSSTVCAGTSIAQVLALWRSGREEEARAACESLTAEADDADALSLLAEIHSSARRDVQATVTLRRLIRLRPTDAAARRRLGDSLLASGAFPEAQASYREALAIEPANARAYNNLGRALMGLRKHAEAVSSYRQAIALDPRYAIAHNNLGVALYEQGAHEQSVVHFRQALELAPSFVEALIGLGNALQRLKRFGDAVTSYERVLQLDPSHTGALTNCASALLALRRPEEALRLSERALALKPDLAGAHGNRGGALRQLHRYAEAAAACEKALQPKPDDARALGNLGNALRALGRPQEALDCCDRAIALEPALLEAHLQRAAALLDLQQPDLAAEGYARALAIAPDHPFVLGAMLHARALCCDWRVHEEGLERLTEQVLAGKAVAHPMTFLAFSDSPAAQLRCARTYAEDQLAAGPAVLVPLTRGAQRRDRIRIAYLSADFHQHATGYVMAGMFEAHDRGRFETMAISYGPDDGSDMRRRLQQAFDRFLDVRSMSDADVARLVQSLEVDIAVDLKGHTRNSRIGILAARPALLQVSYMGFPGTTGLPHLDYVIADPIVIPREQQIHYSERVVYLPECYWVNDSKRRIAEHTPSRADLGLPPDAFVFCCFNNNHKITPAMFDIWMHMLEQVPGSVLWLLADNPAVIGNLRRETALRNVDPGRLVFAARVASEEHLARHRCADLGVDTLPYNAHTTACDALWAGLPVLTCLGRTFPGRVCASVLHAVGLPELATHSREEYAKRAIELATDAEQLRRLRLRLSRNVGTHPLFNTERFCRHLESAYEIMWRRHRDGLPPGGFTVPLLADRPAILSSNGNPASAS